MEGSEEPRLLWREVNDCIIQIQSGDSLNTCVTKSQTLMERCACVSLYWHVVKRLNTVGRFLLQILKAYN